MFRRWSLSVYFHIYSYIYIDTYIYILIIIIINYYYYYCYYFFIIYIYTYYYIYLEPVCSLFWGMDMYYSSVFMAYPKYAPLLKKRVFDVLGFFFMIFNLLTILSPSAKENISAHTQMPSQNGCTSPRVNKTLLKPTQYFTCLFSLLFFPPCARHRISNHSNPGPFDHHRTFAAPTEPK